MCCSKAETLVPETPVSFSREWKETMHAMQCFCIGYLLRFLPCIVIFTFVIVLST